MVIHPEDVKRQLLLLKEEKLKRAQQPLKKYNPDSAPGHDQISYHKSDAWCRLVFGGNQSGKSVTAAAECAWTLLGNHPFREINKPQRNWVISSEYRNIFEGIWRHLRPDGQDYNGMGFLPPHSIYKMGPKLPQADIPAFVEVKFKNTDRKSRVDFISSEGGTKARQRVASAAIDNLFIDEEIEEKIFEELLMRLLAQAGRFTISATLINSEQFMLDLEEKGEKGDPRVFLTRLDTTQNLHISSESKDRVFEFIRTDEEREVRQLGKSRRSHGLVYTPFNSIQPFKIPQHWPRYCALDPGYRTFAGLWVAKNLGAEDYETRKILDDNKIQENDIICYREMYLNHTTLEDVVQFINIEEGWEPEGFTRKPVTPSSEYITRFIDPAANKTPEDGGMSVFNQLSSIHGLYCMPAYNSLEGGITAVRYFHPKIHIFSSLENLIKEQRTYRIMPDESSRHSNERKALPVQKKDHLLDCLRYLCLNFINDEFKNRKVEQKEKASLTERVLRLVTKQKGHPILGSEY